MKRKYYPLIVIIFFMFFIFILYTYNFFIELKNNDDFSADDVEIPIITKKIKNIYYDINDSLNKKYAIKMTDYNKEIPIFNDKGNFINLNNFSDVLDISKIVQFNKILKSKNKDFLFLMLPEKSYFALNKLNEYSYNYDFFRKENAIKELKNNSVDYINSYDVLNNMDIEPNNLFYKTDHHWTLETGLKFTRELVKHINEKYQLELDYKKLDINNYKQNCIKESYRGSFSIYSNSNVRDDFIYYNPRFETNFTVIDENGTKKGSIENVIYKINENKKGYFGERYCRIAGGTNDYTRIINNNATNDIKLLFIGNSYTKSITPFLSSLVRENVIVDIRSGVGNYNQGIQKLIKNYNPDLVIFLTEMFKEDDYKVLFK